MKYRESGMPGEQVWNNFFNPEQILHDLDIDGGIDILLDIGCGYGTFLIPAAKQVHLAIGIDIDREVIESAKEKIRMQGLENVKLLTADISAEQTQNELAEYKGKIGYVCLFNILHCEEPVKLLCSASNLLKEGGKIGIIHWRHEDTPRGPSMQIRPTPDAVIGWASETGLSLVKQADLPPYHYGLVFMKNSKGCR